MTPEGHAVAIVARVDEPHAFLRSCSEPFLTTIGDWRDRCDGIYTEIRDAEPVPALAVGWHRGGGFSGTRRDVECCAPFLGLSRPSDSPGPPPCPVFG